MDFLLIVGLLSVALYNHYRLSMMNKRILSKLDDLKAQASKIVTTMSKDVK